MQSLFITATGTEIGKTLVTCALMHQLTRTGYPYTVFKPVVSGFAADDPQSDPALLLEAAGESPTREAIARISPWRYAAPLSPHLAGKNASPSVTEIAAYCRAASPVLIEGAGGVMTPLNRRETMLDLMQALTMPAVLVTGSYLGAISHTLTALESLRQRNIPLAGIVLSESAQGIALTDMESSLRLFAPASIPLYTIPRIATPRQKWRDVPEIIALCRKLPTC